MSEGTRPTPVLEVRIEPSRNHTCPYNIPLMEEMFRELLLRAGYNEGVFRVKPGKFVHGTSATAQQGITIGIAYPYAMSCEIQFGSNDRRCEAFLIPPSGTDTQELARVLIETIKAQKKKPARPVAGQGATTEPEPEPEPAPLTPPDEEDLLLIEGESLTERLQTIAQEQTTISGEVAKLTEAKSPLIKQAEDEQSALFRVQGCIRDCEIRLARFQSEQAVCQADLAKTQDSLAGKDRQIDEQTKKDARLQEETATIQARIAALHARMAELDRDRARQRVLQQTQAQIAASGLSREDQIRLAEEMLAQLREPVPLSS